MYCPTCRIEKCVYISTNKTTIFYDCKKCKACCHVLSIPFKDQKSTFMLFGGDGTHCFIWKTSCDYEKEKPSPFLNKFLRDSDPSTSEPEPKRAEVISYSIYGIIVSTPQWLIQLTKTSITISFYTLSVFIKAAWFSQSPKTVLSVLSTLDQIQWLWR